MRTGNTEYSFTRLSKWESRTQSSEAFRAILRKHAAQKGEVVVVKILKGATVSNGDNDSDPTVGDRWLQEFRLLSKLKHPHIAGLVAFDARIWSLYIEHKDGQDLASPKWCFSGGEKAHFFKGSAIDACHILADIASALAYMGRLGRIGGFLHGNIKPGNILYRRNNAKVTRLSQYGAILIDFSDATEGRTFLRKEGTPWYLAPETFKHRHGRERDMYALGVVMLYLLGNIGLPERTEPPLVWDATSLGLIAREQIREWHARVEEWRKSLQPRKGCTGVEAELVAIVRTMLLQENRLTAEELEEATRKWALY
ncbi:Serine/threonine-protein kinase PkaA [Cytospora mali]|uniref:Serine/threonine-protein kinase PkaA n=1 Tax=Cytospora mali TaxID=578113 RepID=A0A194VPQ3_CYTMA|nr:Serine/threonine-protein kinase PkaA [Valsa mali]